MAARARFISPAAARGARPFRPPRCQGRKPSALPAAAACRRSVSGIARQDCGSVGSWQTKHGRGFLSELRRAAARESRSCGGRTRRRRRAPPWQATQSRSVWQLTHAFRLRSASNPWCPGFIGGSLQMPLGGWKRRAVLGARGARLGDADAHVAVEAEALLAVAALALLRLHARLDGVHVQVVVRVDAARAHAAVVAVGAEVLLVAVGAELRVVGGDRLVALDEVGRVLGVVQPARRQERARSRTSS